MLIALIPKTEKFGDLVSRGVVKRHELSKGQKTLDFGKSIKSLDSSDAIPSPAGEASDTVDSKGDEMEVDTPQTVADTTKSSHNDVLIS